MMYSRAALPILITLSLVLAVSPRDGAAARQLPAGANAFVIDLDTSGGFTGRGLGGVTIDSEGQVRGSGLGGTNRQSSKCRTQLPEEDLKSLRVALEAARVQPWPETFAPAGDDGCCDRHRWTLRLEQRLANGQARTAKTMWYDANESRLPNEVTVMRDIAMRALKGALAECGRGGMIGHAFTLYRLAPSTN
jgi:hypothetical protein